MTAVETISLFDTNLDGKFDKEDFKAIGIELESLETDILKKQIIEVAPKYKKEIQKIKDKNTLKQYLYLFWFANNVLDEKAKKALLKWEVVDWFEWDVPLKETVNFLKDLLALEKEYLEEEFKVVVLTLDELKQLETLLVSNNTREQLNEFLKLQLKENISSYQVVENTQLGEKLNKILWKEKTKRFLNNLDTKFRKLASRFLPENISSDTLYNIWTGLNLGLMEIYANLPKKERKSFMEVLNWLNEISDWKSWLDKLDGFVSTVGNASSVYKVFKIFSGIRAFLNAVKVKAERFWIKAEKDWEKYTNLNNPTKFANVFKEYEDGLIKWLSNEDLDKIVDKLFSDVEIDEKNRIEKINQLSSSLKENVAKLSKNIDSDDLKVLLNVSKIDRKIIKFKEKIEKKVWGYINKFKDIFEKIWKLLCVWQGENCKSEIMGTFYGIISVIVEFLKSLWLDINVKDLRIEHLQEDLKNFNKIVKKVFLEDILKKWKDGKYRLAEELINNPLFKEFSKNGKVFEVISFNWRLSKQTLDWFKKQKVDIESKEKIFKFIVDKLNNPDFIEALNAKNINLEKYQIIKVDDSILTIDFNNLDYLLKEWYWYWDVVTDALRQSEEQVIDELKIRGDKLVFKENYPEYKKVFLKKIYPSAKQVADKLWIPAIVILSQAALESKWGRSKLAKEANNLFWIKAWNNWKWPVYEVVTTEYKNWKPYKVIARFRKYSNWEESIKDYVNLLSSPRYQKVLASINKSDPKQVFEALKEAWYATDPIYWKKLADIAYNDILSGLENVA